MNWHQQIHGAEEAKYSNAPPEIKPLEMAGWGQERLVAAGHRAAKQVHDLAGAATGILDREGMAGRFDDWLNRCLRTNNRDAVAGAVGGIANVFAGWNGSGRCYDARNHLGKPETSAFSRSRLSASTRWLSRPTTVVAMVSALRMASSVASTVDVINGFRCVSARCVC